MSSHDEVLAEFGLTRKNLEGLHVDRYHLTWNENTDELVERITRDDKIECRRWADGTPALPWTNGYGYVTDWHADGECAAHKPYYTVTECPDGLLPAPSDAAVSPSNAPAEPDRLRPIATPPSTSSQ